MQDGRNVTIITGYPRSRTAWLSVLFDVPGVSSHHEVLHRINPITQEGLSGLDAFNGPVVICDSSAALFHPKIMGLWPKSRWVFINRDRADVASSLKRLLPKTANRIDSEVLPMMDQFLELCKKSSTTHTRMEADYNDLGSPETLARIWKFSSPGVEFNAFRANRLIGMKIEAMEWSGQIEVCTDCSGAWETRKIQWDEGCFRKTGSN